MRLLLITPAAYPFIILVVLALTAEMITPYGYADINLAKRLMGPMMEHPLGTDVLGRDVLSRLLVGVRFVLIITSASVLLGLVLGLVVGVLAGYKGGWADQAISILLDIMLSFPLVLLALAIIAVIGTGLSNVILAVGLAQFPHVARLARGLVVAEKERLYVEAAKAAGLSGPRIMFGSILPNILGPLLVQSSFNATSAILASAALGFLGLGVQPPAPEWGTMVYENRLFMVIAPHAVIFPSLTIFGVAYYFNWLGEVARDRLDPKLSRLIK